MTLSYQTRIIAAAGVMLVVLCLVMAALWLPKIERTVKVMDILFVLDITQSMEVQDVEIDGKLASRLQWAQYFTKKTLVDLPCGAHVGLAAFSEYRSLILINPVEVCQNYHDLTQMIDKITGPMAWALSSEVSKAAFTAIEQSKLMDPSPSIVFITDGHESPPLHKTLHAKFKGTIGEVPGVFVGVGGDDLLPIPKRDLDGNELGFWQVNEVLHQDVYASSRGDQSEQNAKKEKTEHMSSQKKAHLTSLATMIGFDYIASPTKSKKLVTLIENIAKTRDQTVSYNWSPWLASTALLLLLLMYLPFNLSRNKAL
ncbi:MAG: vWA domain-containing protein [Methylophagaceae bacterium]